MTQEHLKYLKTQEVLMERSTPKTA